MKFRKKPVVIEAVQYDGTNLSAVVAEFPDLDYYLLGGGTLIVYTLEGKLVVSIGDWIIQGVNGEYYPCKPDIFEKIYEAA